MISAEETLDRCSAESGYDLSGQTPVDYLEERFHELTGLVYDEVGYGGLDQVSAGTIEALQAEERQLAEVDAECQAEYFETRDEVGSDLEQKIVEENPEVVALLIR